MKILAKELQEEIKQLEIKLECAYPDLNPELIIYATDGSWMITFKNGDETIGDNIEELYNFVENSLDV